MSGKIVVLVTCRSAREARRIARTIVARKLAACANLISTPVESIYRWKGNVESAKEFLLVIKTTRKRFAALRNAVQGLHSYDLPEIIALPISDGSRKYLAWIDESVAARLPSRKIR